MGLKIPGPQGIEGSIPSPGTKKTIHILRLTSVPMSDKVAESIVSPKIPQMDLDIIRKIKRVHLKATFGSLTLKHKFFLIIFLLSFTTTLLPHETFAQIIPAAAHGQDNGPVLVFDSGNTDVQDYLNQINQTLKDQYYQQQLIKQALYEQTLAAKVKAYLEQQGSPLADYASTLITLRNWKKIISLASAESSMCEHYPQATSNCWGVGGAKLWNMGDNLGQGIVAMNHFLNNYPLHSGVKYSQMSIDQMNGLYKQPPADHWINNNQIAYDDLTAIEESIQ